MKSTSATLQFSELLLVLFKGKTGLVDALHILAGEGIEKRIRDSAVSLLAAMKKGKGLSEGLRSINSGGVYFESLYLTLIAAAEMTGNIEEVIERIVIDLRRKEKARENVINIMIYPSIIVLLAVAGTILIIVKGIPMFIASGLLSQDAVSDATGGIFIAGAVLLAGGTALFTVYFRIFYYDSPELRIFYLLDFLLRSNVSLLEALSQCVISIKETKYGRALVAIKKDIAAGIPFSAAFAKIKFFSPYVLGWLAIADTHGSINEICGSIKDYYEHRDNKVREIAAKLIEPAVIVLTGLYVLIIVTTVILPVLTFTGGIL
jgi:type II secretory pathway component PulF